MKIKFIFSIEYLVKLAILLLFSNSLAISLNLQQNNSIPNGIRKVISQKPNTRVSPSTFCVIKSTRTATVNRDENHRNIYSLVDYTLSPLSVVIPINFIAPSERFSFSSWQTSNTFSISIISQFACNKHLQLNPCNPIITTLEKISTAILTIKQN